MNPSSIVFVSVVTIAGTTVIRRVKEDKWEGHIVEVVVFAFLLLIALQLLALVLPGVAKVLGYLGIVGAFVINGPAVFGAAETFGRGKRDIKHGADISHAGEMRRG